MKKLKGLGSRAYNVLFHTHTVAGIVISFALFVIFYAGAFSLFRHEVAQWENPDFRQELKEDIDIDATLAKIDEQFGIDYSQRTNIQLPNEERPVLTVYGTQKTEDSTRAYVSAYYNPASGEIQDTKTARTTVNTTIYFLHYLAEWEEPEERSQEHSYSDCKEESQVLCKLICPCYTYMYLSCLRSQYFFLSSPT